MFLSLFALNLLAAGSSVQRDVFRLVAVCFRLSIVSLRLRSGQAGKFQDS